jgi:hypothetical protein
MARSTTVLAIVLLAFCVAFGAWKGTEVLSGHVTTRMVVIVKVPVNCSFALSSGWNLLGLSCEPNNSTPWSLVNNPNNSITSIHKYSSNDIDDPWKVYAPGLPSWVVLDLDRLDRVNGYWINSRNDSLVHINGTLRLPTFASVGSGWQLLGYPQLERRNISAALASLSGKYVSAYSYNETSGQWKTYLPNKAWKTQGFKWMNPHEGFWINMREQGEWQVE